MKNEHLLYGKLTYEDWCAFLKGTPTEVFVSGHWHLITKKFLAQLVYGREQKGSDWCEILQARLLCMFTDTEIFAALGAADKHKAMLDCRLTLDPKGKLTGAHLD